MKLFRAFRTRLSTISMQFFFNYMLLFILLVLIGGMATAASLFYLYNRMDLASLNFDIEAISQDIDKNGLTQAWFNAQLPEDSYIEIISRDLKVKAEINSPHQVGYRYSQDFFNRILINYFPEYTFYYPENSNTILLIVTPEVKQGMDFVRMLLGTFGIVLICLVLAVVIYSQITSVMFVKPITHLLEGVNRIREGDYATRIQFKSHNELEKLKEAINGMAERIQSEISARERSENNQKRLILGISHDLKTPLTNIQGYAESVMATLPAEYDELNHSMEVILANSTRANKLLHDLFDLTRYDVSGLEMNLEAVDICEFTRQVLSSYIQEMDAQELSYQFDIPDDPEWTCLINRNQMERAMGNLLINCIKYCGRNATLLLQVEEAETTDQVRIILEDTGPGIQPKDQPYVFQLFFRTDESRNSRTGGTGLGLAISRMIVERHQGTLVLDPEYTDGCRFVITLPKAI